MGRQIRHVPLDFNWPLHKVWEGFLNPHWRQCSQCENGYSPAYKALEKHVNNLMWDRELQQYPETAKLTKFLAGRPSGFMGHDCIDRYSAIKKLCEMAGVEDGDWTKCKNCDGSAIDPTVKEAYEAWKEQPPPEGPGWQVWETVSEGSPISPVFKTPDELVEWLVGEGYSREGAKGFVRTEWAPSMIIQGGVIKKDIEAMSDAKAT